jgi:hypothetical protein
MQGEIVLDWNLELYGVVCKLHNALLHLAPHFTFFWGVIKNHFMLQRFLRGET